MRVKTLLLDVGGVLATNGWDHDLRREAAAHFSLDHADFEERHHLTFDTYEVGKLSLDEYLTRVVFHRERHFTRAEFKDFIFSHSRPHQEMINLVKALKPAYHLKIAIVSNEGREFAINTIEKHGLGSFVDFFVVSSFVHIRKPDHEIYHLTLDIAQTRPEEVLYLEDRLMFIEVASSLGIPSIRHTGYRTTREALERAGLSLEGKSQASRYPALGKDHHEDDETAYRH